jgi:hypothetical protein
MKKMFSSFTALLVIIIIITGCEQSSVDNPVSTEGSLQKNPSLLGTVSSAASNAILNKELALARSSTAKYHNIESALADGYLDINLYIPHMGWHFLNPAYVDGVFEVDKPELLVYANKPGGGYRLVAVEYGVPLSFPMPDGFTGDEDMWTENLDAGMWTLHAWIWLNNPDGVFHPHNTRVP